jgi:hypothetical protein
VGSRLGRECGGCAVRRGGDGESSTRRGARLYSLICSFLKLGRAHGKCGFKLAAAYGTLGRETIASEVVRCCWTALHAEAAHQDGVPLAAGDAVTPAASRGCARWCSAQGPLRRGPQGVPVGCHLRLGLTSTPD